MIFYKKYVLIKTLSDVGNKRRPIVECVYNTRNCLLEFKGSFAGLVTHVMYGQLGAQWQIHVLR